MFTPDMMRLRAVRPVDAQVEALLGLVAKREMALKQRSPELGTGKLNRALSIHGQLMKKPDGKELYEDLPGEAKALIKVADKIIRPKQPLDFSPNRRTIRGYQGLLCLDNPIKSCQKGPAFLTWFDIKSADR